jgi:hypothetical protein
MVTSNTCWRTSLTVAVVLGLLILPWAKVSPASASGNPVGQIVADIASLPFAQPDSCQGLVSAVQGGGIVEQDLDQALGTDFQPITITPNECTVLVTFIPIVGSYNDVIIAAQQYNPNNSTSVTNFYEKSFILAAEVTLVGFALDGTLYKASFQATGELNDGLKLGKLQSICGDTCYADVLSATYWFIKGAAISALDGFLTWVFTNLPSSITSNLPRPNDLPVLGSIGAFGIDQASLYLIACLAIIIAFALMRKWQYGTDESQ